MDNEYTLLGHELTLNSYSLTKGSFTIRAYDSDGAYCTFSVTVKTINMTLLGFILLGGGIFVFLVISFIVWWILSNKRYMGSCYVTQFDSDGNYYGEIKKDRGRGPQGRGRIPLSDFNLSNSGFNDSKCYFQASGKDYVTFHTREKVYGDGRFDKKFRVDGNGYEVTIAPDEKMLKGIRVKFVSRLNNTNSLY